MKINFVDVIKKARSELNMLTGLEISSTISAKPDEDGWKVTLEAIEKKSIPDNMDILAIYETILDQEGNMLKFDRVRMRKRIDTEDIE